MTSAEAPSRTDIRCRLLHGDSLAQPVRMQQPGHPRRSLNADWNGSPATSLRKTECEAAGEAARLGGGADSK